MAWILVELMTQVFDPAPEQLFIPWSYIGFLTLGGFIAQLRKTLESLSFSVRND